MRLRSFISSPFLLPAIFFPVTLCSVPLRAQLLEGSSAALSAVSTPASDRDSLSGSSSADPNAAGSNEGGESSSDFALPSAPEPAGGDERANTPWAAKEHQQPFSRVGIGADVSPLGIGIKSAIVLTQTFDARLMGNYFNYNTGQFELEGFRVNADFHWASAAASLDWYPLNSIWRLSVGTLFFNGNQISAKSDIAPGTDISLNGQDFYSANANALTGATPLTGSGVIGFHAREPALTLAGGFGKFIPRSNRHWSFPSEFGVALTGAPTVDVNLAGWVCLDKAQTQCSNLSNTAAPVSVQFNNALQASLAKWRKSLSEVQIYPLFSYSVVYSFNVR